MVLFESHFELNQLQNDALKAPKQQQSSFMHEILKSLPLLQVGNALLFYLLVNSHLFYNELL